MDIFDKLNFYEKVDTEKAWEQFVDMRNKHKRTRILRILGTGSIAAAVIAIGVVATKLYDKEATDTPIVAYNGTEITPKYEHATITVGGNTIELADGTTVSGEDGSVVKDANGSILYNNVKSEPMTLNVPRGGEYSLTLSDGTHIWLNAESELHFPSHFTSDTRIISIKGEAYMEVAKDISRPFIVKTGNAQVHVTGTRFNVRNYQDESSLKVTLVSGAVTMESVDDGKKMVELTPGKQFTLNNSTGKHTVTYADISEVLAWHNGIFVFEQKTLLSMANELSRWYDIKIEVDPSVAQLRYSGELNRSQSIEPLLKILRRTGELDFEKTSTGMKIFKKLK